MDISRRTLWWPGWNGQQGVGRRRGGHEPLRQGSGQGAVVAGTEISPGRGPHVTTHFGASDNINMFSHRPGGQMPKFKASAGLCSFWMVQGRLFPGRFQFLGSWPFLHLQSTSLPPLALLPQLFFLTLIFLFPSLSILGTTLGPQR